MGSGIGRAGGTLAALALGLALCLAPGAARGAWDVRVVVEAPSPVAGDPASVTDARVDALLAATLDRETARAVRGSAAAVRKVREILSFLESPAGRDWRLDVRADRERGGAIVVRLVLRGQAVLDTRRDVARPATTDVDLPQATVRLTRRPDAPPRDPVVPPPPAPPPIADAVPPRGEVCAQGDEACWRRSTLVPGNEPSCTRYLVEADAHRRRLDQFGDPNVGWQQPVDLDAPRKERAERMTLAGQQLPASRSEYSSLAELDASRRDSPSSGPGLPREPTDECLAEWKAASPRALPSLACALEAERWERWVLRDPLARAATLPGLSLIGQLPILSNYLAFRGRQAAEDKSGEGFWAARWMDRVATAFQAGDESLLDEGMARVATRADERKSLAGHLRRWVDRPEYRDWQPVVNRIYGEHFGELYPEAVGRDGMPVLDRFPVRLWWATNWVAAVRRAGLETGAALEMLRCAPGGDRAVALLRDLSSWLKGQPRYRDVVESLEARL